jgi:hypothetical protein
MQGESIHISKRFPDLQMVIDTAKDQSETLSELVQDYEECYRASREAMNSALECENQANEYQVLLGQLELEIIEALKERNLIENSNVIRIFDPSEKSSTKPCKLHE